MLGSLTLTKRSRTLQFDGKTDAENVDPFQRGKDRADSHWTRERPLVKASVRAFEQEQASAASSAMEFLKKQQRHVGLLYNPLCLARVNAFLHDVHIITL